MAGNYPRDIEYRLLKIFAESSIPIGAGYLFDNLQEDGNPILSEATFGRYLRRFEQQGYLESRRYDGRSRGRVITEKGRRRLSELSVQNERQRSIRDVMDLFDENTDKQLRDTLIARRIVEPEMAALAAQNATESNLAAIRAILDEMDNLTKVGQSMASTDGPFHLEIARASGNSLIESILKIARTDQDHSPKIEYIINHTSRRTSSDHWRIYNAIAEHDPNKARRIMREHIEKLIEKLEDYENEKSG